MPKDKIGDVKVMNNEYDNEKFFEEYAKMSRSKEGLKAAGEWHQLKPLFLVGYRILRKCGIMQDMIFSWSAWFRQRNCPI